MKRLLFILIALAFIGCQSPTETKQEKDFEPFTIGSFKITTPTTAEYIGDKAKKKSSIYTSDADTIEIRTPDNRHMELWHNDSMIESYFKMQLIDSTLSESNTNTDNGMGTKVSFDNPASGNGYGFSQSSSSLQWDTDRFVGEWTMRFNCGTDFNKKAPILLMTFYRKDGKTPYRVYRIHVNGIVDTINTILCD